MMESAIRHRKPRNQNENIFSNDVMAAIIVRKFTNSQMPNLGIVGGQGH